jgi:hypothetical protein
MLSNQGQAVNLRDGSPLYPFNFTQRHILRVYRLPCRRSVPPLQIHPINTTKKPNNYAYVLCDVGLLYLPEVTSGTELLPLDRDSQSNPRRMVLSKYVHLRTHPVTIAAAKYTNLHLPCL